MTIINRRHQRVILQQSGLDNFWHTLQEHFAGESARRWRELAMLSLRVNSGWSLTQLSFLFGRDKTEISRVLLRLRKELRRRFHVQWRNPARDRSPSTSPTEPGATPHSSVCRRDPRRGQSRSSLREKNSGR